MTTLEFIKSHESDDGLILIIHDPFAQKVMAAWERYELPGARAEKMDRKLRANESLKGVLHELWEKSETNFEELAKIAGLPYQVVREQFERLKAAQLVYPDCTIPSGARRLLRNIVNAYRFSLLPKQMRGTVPTPATPPAPPSVAP